MESMIVAISLSIWLGIIVFFLGIAVLDIVAKWRIFEKAGEAGWKSLIPFYRDYTFFKISWNKNVYFIFLASTIIGGMLFFLYGMVFADSEVSSILIFLMFILIYVVPFICRIGLYINLVKSFGLGGAFVIGLILFYPIFMLILAFNSATYKKINDMA